MPKLLPALAARAAVVATAAAAAAVTAVLPATTVAAAPATAVPAVAATPLVTVPAVTVPVVTVPIVTVPVATVAFSAPRLAAVNIALGRRGAPYRYGAAGPNAFDCSGLMKWSFAQAGITLPRTSRAQSLVGTPVAKADLQPGDLVFCYRPVRHVAMYIGNGKVVHASTYGQPVRISDLNTMPFNSARRI